MANIKQRHAIMFTCNIPEFYNCMIYSENDSLCPLDFLSSYNMIVQSRTVSVLQQIVKYSQCTLQVS